MTTSTNAGRGGGPGFYGFFYESWKKPSGSTARGANCSAGSLGILKAYFDLQPIQPVFPALASLLLVTVFAASQSSDNDGFLTVFNSEMLPFTQYLSHGEPTNRPKTQNEKQHKTTKTKNHFNPGSAFPLTALGACAGCCSGVVASRVLSRSATRQLLWPVQSVRLACVHMRPCSRAPETHSQPTPSGVPTNLCFRRCSQRH